MMPEAAMTETEGGRLPRGEGWYVLNLADSAWRTNGRFGAWCGFEGDVKFNEYGINVQVLWPGQPNAHYHEENAQEDFLVLSGECLLIVEGQERPLRAWDFVHSPPGTRHIFVGAGDGPCAILMTGTRKGSGEQLVYPADPVAARYGAASPVTTTDPAVSYAAIPPSTPMRSPWPIRANHPRP